MWAESLDIATHAFAFVAVFLLLFNLLLGELLPGTAAHPYDVFGLGNAFSDWGMLFLLAAGPTILGFGLYITSMSYLPSSVANLVITLEPVFTALTAYVLLGERLGVIQIAGSVMIFAGVIFLRVYEGWITGQHQSKLQEAVSPASAD